MSPHDLVIERIADTLSYRSFLRVSLEIAGEVYSFQIIEPQIEERINIVTEPPRIGRVMGSDIIIDSPEKRASLIYERIYGHIVSLLCGAALNRTMAAIHAIFQQTGDWDNTGGRHAHGRVNRNGTVSASTPPTSTLTREHLMRSTRALELNNAYAILPDYHASMAVGVTASEISMAMIEADRHMSEALRRMRENVIFGMSVFPLGGKDAPSRKAWLLLYKTIGRKLYKQFKKHGYFEVEGKRGTYRFHKSRPGGVTFTEQRQYGSRTVPVTFDLCIQSQAPDLPAGDVIVSRYLTWKADEEAFLQTANFRNISCPDEALTRR